MAGGWQKKRRRGKWYDLYLLYDGGAKCGSLEFYSNNEMECEFVSKRLNSKE